MKKNLVKNQGIGLALTTLLSLTSCATNRTHKTEHESMPDREQSAKVAHSQSEVGSVGTRAPAMYGRVIHFEDLVRQYGSVGNALNAVRQAPMAVIDFFAEWCGPCRQLAPVFEAVAAQYPTVMFVKINTEKYDKISSEYRVRGIPNLTFLRNGARVGQVVGSRSQDALAQEVRNIFQITA